MLRFGGHLWVGVSFRCGFPRFLPLDGGRLRCAPQGRRHRALRASVALHLDPLRCDGGLAAIRKPGRCGRGGGQPRPSAEPPRHKHGLAAGNGHSAGAVTPGGVAAGPGVWRTPRPGADACPCAGAERLGVSRPVMVRGEPLGLGADACLCAGALPGWVSRLVMVCGEPPAGGWGLVSGGRSEPGRG